MNLRQLEYSLFSEKQETRCCARAEGNKGLGTGSGLNKLVPGRQHLYTVTLLHRS